MFFRISTFSNKIHFGTFWGLRPSTLFAKELHDNGVLTRESYQFFVRPVFGRGQKIDDSHDVDVHSGDGRDRHVNKNAGFWQGQGHREAHSQRLRAFLCVSAPLQVVASKYLIFNVARHHKWCGCGTAPVHRPALNHGRGKRRCRPPRDASDDVSVVRQQGPRLEAAREAPCWSPLDH